MRNAEVGMRNGDNSEGGSLNAEWIQLGNEGISECANLGMNR